jgi:hypothetical protein
MVDVTDLRVYSGSLRYIPNRLRIPMLNHAKSQRANKRKSSIIAPIHSFGKEPSTPRRNSFGSLGSQWTPRVGPFEGFGHRAIEVVDELQNPLAQLVHGAEAGSFQQLANQDTEPNLNLI